MNSSAPDQQPLMLSSFTAVFNENMGLLGQVIQTIQAEVATLRASVTQQVQAVNARVTALDEKVRWLLWKSMWIIMKGKWKNRRYVVEVTALQYPTFQSSYKERTCRTCY